MNIGVVVGLFITVCWCLLALLLAARWWNTRQPRPRIVTGHVLSTAGWHTSGFYEASCACGTTVYGRTLPQLWAAHGVHLEAVRAMSARRHPAGGAR